MEPTINEIRPKEWYYEDWVIIISLFIFLPIGIILGVKSPHKFPFKKLLIGIGVVFLFMVLSVLSKVSSNNTSAISGKAYFGVNLNHRSTYEIEFVDDSTFKWSRIKNPEYGNATASFDKGTYTFDGTNIRCAFNSGDIRTMKYNKPENSIDDGATAFEFDDPLKRNK